MNHYDCHNIKGSEHNEPDAIYCAAADNEPDAIYCAGADEPDAIYCTAADNEPDTIYCSTDDIVTVAEEGLLSSDHSIETTECVAYGTNEAEDPNAPEDSNESDTRNSEIYEAIC